MSTAELEQRRSEINRLIANDELGFYYGPTRWVSHAVEERNVNHEKRAIDSELARRHGTAPSNGEPEVIPETQ